jgi:endonuclease YncB( thermonuclease family)
MGVRGVERVQWGVGEGRCSRDWGVGAMNMVVQLVAGSGDKRAVQTAGGQGGKVDTSLGVWWLWGSSAAPTEDLPSAATRA